MLHSAITKSTTTLLKNTTSLKDVAFGYYQKYNNINKKYNITKMLHSAITKSTTTLLAITKSTTIYSKH